MAISFVQSKQNNGNSAAPTATYTSGPTQNNLLVAWVDSIIDTTITMTSGGWTAMTSITAGTGSTRRATRGFYKIAGAGESSTVTAASGANSWSIVLAEYSGVDTSSPLLVENAQANAAGTTNTPSVTPTASKSAIVVFLVAIRGAGTWSAEQVNSSGTGVNAREQINSITPGMTLADLLVSSTSGSYQGSATQTATSVGAGGIAIFLAAAAAAAPKLLALTGVG